MQWKNPMGQKIYNRCMLDCNPQIGFAPDASVGQQSGYTVIDLFAGCGGLSLGMRRAGFRVLAAVDLDLHATQVYEANSVSEHPVFHKDVQGFKPQMLRNATGIKTVDVMVAGLPCQGFSNARQVDGSNSGKRLVPDERRELFHPFMRYVRYFKPKVFIIENVVGMRATEDGRVYDALFRAASRAGYKLDCEVLHAAQFGVPQKRRRLIYVGVQKNLPPFKVGERIRPTHSEGGCRGRGLEPQVTLWEAIGDLPSLSAGTGGGRPNRQRLQKQLAKYGERYIRDVVNASPDRELTAHKARYHSERDLGDFDKLREGENSGQAERRGQKMDFPYSRKSFCDRYTRQKRNGLASTIVAHMSKDGLMFIHPTQRRSLTPREAARLQSFPDDFVFPVAQTHQYRLIGNAVPPLLACAVGRAVAAYLRELGR